MRVSIGKHSGVSTLTVKKSYNLTVKKSKF